MTVALPTIRFEVLGTPKPQGSMRAFKARNGAVINKPSGGNEFAAWRNAVAEAARAQAGHHGMLDGPVELDVTFRFAMPKSRPKADRERGVSPKVSAPDLDKLVRCVADALVAGGLIRDDSLIVSCSADKQEVWGAWTGAGIVLGEWSP